ncbi:hypothetical protein BDQ17DRAFT_1437261 [Cyathus striatus]|nr:hypothetical protein BDQ17DRAFT_1437261 [Cyathus striatus]
MPLCAMLIPAGNVDFSPCNLDPLVPLKIDLPPLRESSPMVTSSPVAPPATPPTARNSSPMDVGEIKEFLQHFLTQSIPFAPTPPSSPLHIPSSMILPIVLPLSVHSYMIPPITTLEEEVQSIPLCNPSVELDPTAGVKPKVKPNVESASQPPCKLVYMHAGPPPKCQKVKVIMPQHTIGEQLHSGFGDIANIIAYSLRNAKPTVPEHVDIGEVIELSDLDGNQLRQSSVDVHLYHVVRSSHLTLI